MSEIAIVDNEVKPRRRRMSVAEIQTMLGILELYDIPVHDMRRDMYDDCVLILEAKRDEYKYKLAGIMALMSRLARM
jgi:hypothetical protein